MKQYIKFLFSEFGRAAEIDCFDKFSTHYPYAISETGSNRGLIIIRDLKEELLINHYNTSHEPTDQGKDI